MLFVERLKPFGEIGTVIPCREMTLLGADWEPPVVVGRGEIVVESATSFRYRLVGTPDDIGHALRTMNRIRADPYNGLLRERLDVVTDDGVRLSCGWTIPSLWTSDDEAGAEAEWVFTGNFDALTIDDCGPTPLETHAAYLLPAEGRARIFLRRLFPKAEPGAGSVFTMQVLDTEVTFTLDDRANLLMIHAPGTGKLPVTMTENWLGEPLRILFGQLIYPRFVARGIGTGRMNWVRPSPSWSTETGACGLWQSRASTMKPAQFWDSYARLLAYIAHAGDHEAHAITDFYVEVIQAASGSRWVWALTYASAAEGLINLLFPRGSRRSDLEAVDLIKLASEVDAFKAYVDLWSGDARLKDPAKGAAVRMLETTAMIALRQLRKEGWITPDNFKAWKTIRNDVMHGALVSPYSSAEDDALLLNLSELFHALTRRIVAGVDPATGALGIPPSSAV